MAEPSPAPPAHAPAASPVAATQRVARALLVGDRITTAGLERSDVYSTAPLSFRVGEYGFAAVFRHGVVVLSGLTPLEEDEVLRALEPRIVTPFAPPYEEESLPLQLGADADEAIAPDGVVKLKAFSPAALLVVADILAKSTALAHDEGQVSAVFDTVEPFARDLAERGKPPGGRRSMLKLIGSALLVRHRVSGRVAVHEKPDVLWDRPDLERLYGRLEDEYEIVERAEVLERKLEVIGQAATAMNDIIDTERSVRLELLIV
ncbi:MAG TPA: RMD1 family protein, partial [Caulobacteraceae bacterium]|nr:RMD1 family protein [Caulobacteraceae bacterium]